MNNFDKDILLVERIVERDEYGQEIMVDGEVRQVCGITESLSNFLYFSNAMAGNKLDGVYLIHEIEYNREKIAEIDGVRYEIKRSRPVVKHGYRLVELTVGEADGVR